MDDLLNEFIGETLDMMDAVSSDLVAWQADHTERSGLDGIFRAIHTVKGSSGFFALPRITALSHAAEDLLDGLRARRIQPDRATVSTVLAAFDRIGDIVRSTARAGAEPDGDDAALIAALVNAANANGSGTAQPADDAAAMAVHAMAPPTQGTADSATGGTGPAQADLADLAGESGVGADGGTAPGSAVVEKAALPVATAGDVAAEWRSVRVPLKLLDEVMNGVSDLMLARNEVAAQLRRMDMEQGDLPSFGRLSALLGQVRASVSQMRMVPLRHLFAPLPRQVHQLGGELGKSVSLNVMGGEVEIDREVSEALRDPLTHTMRNAIDHGIESAADRLAAGKPAEGRIAISARQAGNRILISVEDDGRGLNLEALARRAIACGHMTHDQLVRLTPADIANFIFMPGLSTAPAVSGISGRGVGMDVVKANVERLGGTVRVENHPGRGAVLTFDVPMTLTIISALAVEAGGQPFAIARSVVDEVMLASSDVIQRVDAGGAAMVRVRGQIYPLLVLEDVLGLPVDGAMAADDRCYVLCRAGATRRLVLDAPEVRDHDELVIKPLPPVLQSLGLYNGLTLPDSGAPMLMLDVEAIANRYALPLPPILAEPAPVAAPALAQDSWLTFNPWTGDTLAAVRMADVQRITDVECTRIAHAGGRILVEADGTLVPVAAGGFAIPADGRVRMIRLSRDGASDVMLPVRRMSHIITIHDGQIATDYFDGDTPLPLLGIAVFDGAPVELIDSAQLLAGFAPRRPSAPMAGGVGGASAGLADKEGLRA